MVTVSLETRPCEVRLRCKDVGATATIAVLALLEALAPAPAAAATAPDPTVNQIYQAAKAGDFDRAQHMMDQVLHDHPNSAKAHYVQAELYAKQHRNDLARVELAKAAAIDPGFTKENPRSVRQLQEELGLPTAPNAASTTIRIPLAMRGGTLIAPVVINDAIKLDFTVDSGASDVTIPADVYSTLIRAGTIGRSDLGGSQRYTTATGETHEAQTFIIRSLKVGDETVTNVEASVAPARGPLLLGQSFLRRFKNWSIDNSTQELVLQTR